MAEEIITAMKARVVLDSAASKKEVLGAESKECGEVRAEITLVNIKDAGKAEKGLIPKSGVRRLTVNAVVDTGVDSLIINEETREKLGLQVKETSKVSVAGGGKVPCKITEYLEVHWKDRETICEATVLPGEDPVIMGAYTLLGLDLMIHPEKSELVGAHGDKRWEGVEWTEEI
jgi:clan AA aspartic protease